MPSILFYLNKKDENWENLINDWLNFWNRIRKAWYTETGRKGFGAKYNNPKTKKWIERYESEFQALLNRILSKIGNLTVEEGFEYLAELFAIQYGIHEKWYAETHGKVEWSHKENPIQALKFLITKYNYEGKLDFNNEYVKQAWEMIKRRKIKNLLGKWILKYAPCSINEGPIEIRKWSYEEFKKINVLENREERRRKMKEVFNLLTYQDIFKDINI